MRKYSLIAFLLASDTNFVTVLNAMPSRLS